MAEQYINTKTTYRCQHILVRCAPEIVRTNTSVDSQLSWLGQVKRRVCGACRLLAHKRLHYVRITSHDYCPDCERLLLSKGEGRWSEHQTLGRGLHMSARQRAVTFQVPAGEAYEREELSIPKKHFRHQSPGERIRRHPVPPPPPPHLCQPSTNDPHCKRPTTSPSYSRPAIQLRPSRARQQLYKEPEVAPLTEDQGAMIWQDVRDLTQQQLLGHIWTPSISEDTCVEEDCSTRTMLNSSDVQIENPELNPRRPVRRAETSLGFSTESGDIRRYAELHPAPVRVASQTAIICDDRNSDGVSPATDEFDPQWRNEEVSPLSSPTSSPVLGRDHFSWEDEAAFSNDYDHYHFERR